jgi:hypothetical protein
MSIVLLTCVHGRHRELERVVRCFLNQNYRQPITLVIYNNSPVELSLDPQLVGIPDRPIILINNHLDLVTEQEYDNTGAIFRDALSFIEWEPEIINFFDSDDIFLPNHVSEGYMGYRAAQSFNDLAYKPNYSYFLYQDTKHLSSNNMEPSIFVNFMYVKVTGFNYVSGAYHQKWLTPLQKDEKIFQPKDGIPTFIYNWGKLHNNHKISGAEDSLQNFRNHRRWENDNGDRIISAAPKEEVEYFYNLIKDIPLP